MDSDLAIDIGREAINMALMIAAPILIIAFIIGIVMGVLQAITQVQDYTIAVVPKILLMLLVVAFCLPWLMNALTDYSRDLIENIPRVVSGG